METTPSLVTVVSISTASPGRFTDVPLARRSAGRSGSGPAGRAPRIAKWVRSSGTKRDRAVRGASPSKAEVDATQVGPHGHRASGQALVS